MAYETLVKVIPGLWLAVGIIFVSMVFYAIHESLTRKACDVAYEQVTSFAACVANEKSSGFCMISPADIAQSRTDHEYLMNKCGMIAVKVEEL